MKARRILGNVCMILGAVFTIYLSVIMLHRIHNVVLKGIYVKAFRFELAACACFFLLALDLRFRLFTRMHRKAWKGIGWILRIVVTVVVVLFLILFGKVTAGSFISTEAPAKNALVLGLALENGKPTSDLLSRLDTAEKYLRDYPDAVLILTGGNPDKTGKTEAAAMREILIEGGVAEEKIRLEDQARSTKENFQNAAQLIDPNEPTVLISSNYHMDRAVQMAKEAGFSNILRLPAPSSPVYFGANVMWEVIMELNELMSRH